MLKADHINNAFNQLRISGLTVKPTSGEVSNAMSRMEDMISEWQSRNIDLAWQFEPEPDPNSESWAEPWANQAIATNLAVRLTPDFNKQVPNTLLMQATQSLSNLTGRLAMENIRHVDYTERMPRGRANTRRTGAHWDHHYNTICRQPNEAATVDISSGETLDYNQRYHHKMRRDEVISSYGIKTSPGLTLLKHSINNELQAIHYRIKAEAGALVNCPVVTITYTTSQCRVFIDRINFRIHDLSEKAVNSTVIYPDPAELPESLLEVVDLTEGQTVVTFITARVDAADMLIASPGSDNFRLLEGIDYLFIDSSQIRLIESYPAGSKIEAWTLVESLETQTINSGQHEIIWTNPEADVSDFYLSGIDTDGKRLVLVDDYTIVNPAIIHLAETYPNGTVVNMRAGLVLIERVELLPGQRIINFGVAEIASSVFYLWSSNADDKRLGADDMVVTGRNQITLFETYPENSRIFAYSLTDTVTDSTDVYFEC